MQDGAYVTALDQDYKSEFGMSLKQYRDAWEKKYAGAKVEFGFNSIAGYTTGLVLDKALSVATSLDQLELRKAIFSLSGKLKTLDGTFELDPNGGQIGEFTPIGQFVPGADGHLKLVTVWPHDLANGKPIYRVRDDGKVERRRDRSRRSVLNVHLQPARRSAIRALLLSDRPRAQPCVRRHAHRQSGAWRLFDVGRVSGVLAVHAVFDQSGPGGGDRLCRLPDRWTAALLPSGAAAIARQGPGNAVVHSVLWPVAGDRGGNDHRLRYQRKIDTRRSARARGCRSDGVLCRSRGRRRPG